LKLLQKEVAGMLGVDTNTVTNWEKNRCQPKLHILPKIVQFLGYSPFPTESQSVGERIKTYRREHGITQKELAMFLGVDPGTLARWESGKSPPRAHLWVRLATCLQCSQEWKVDGA
jgi:transcriptional regulator with XRE-family HTH domain